MTVTPEEIRARVEELRPWHRMFLSRSGVLFGGLVPIDTEKTTYVRECIAKLGGSISSAVDLGSYEGYHSIQLAELPGVERVLGLEGRARNVAKANLANEYVGYDRVRFQQYDLEQIGRVPPPEEGPFDLVFCAGVHFHLSRNPGSWFSWMNRKVCVKHLFVDTHYAGLLLDRCGSYFGRSLS